MVIIWYYNQVSKVCTAIIYHIEFSLPHFTNSSCQKVTGRVKTILLYSVYKTWCFNLKLITGSYSYCQLSYRCFVFMKKKKILWLIWANSRLSLILWCNFKDCSLFVKLYERIFFLWYFCLWLSLLELDKLFLTNSALLFFFIWLFTVIHPFQIQSRQTKHVFARNFSRVSFPLILI